MNINRFSESEIISNIIKIEFLRGKSLRNGIVTNSNSYKNEGNDVRVDRDGQCVSCSIADDIQYKQVHRPQWRLFRSNISEAPGPPLEAPVSYGRPPRSSSRHV